MSKTDTKIPMLLFAVMTVLFFFSMQIVMAEPFSTKEIQIAKSSSSDLCLCALLKKLDNENHDNGKCDYCGKKIGEFGHIVKEESFCCKIYELHPKCAGMFLDTCEGF